MRAVRGRVKRAIPPYRLDVVVDVEVLRDAAGRIESYVDGLTGEVCRRGLPPILRGMLLRADGAGLTLEATNWEVTGRVTVPGEVHQAGKVMVHARHFCPFTRAFPSGLVRLRAEGQSLEMEFFPDAGELPLRSRCTLLQMPVEDYARELGFAEPVDPQVKPARRSTWESRLARHGTRAAAPKPWKASRASELYSPGPFEVGDWVLIPVDGGDPVAGQVWSAPNRQCAGWALVPGSDGNTVHELRMGRGGRVETEAGSKVERCESALVTDLEPLTLDDLP